MSFRASGPPSFTCVSQSPAVVVLEAAVALEEQKPARPGAIAQTVERRPFNNAKDSHGP